MNAKNTVVAMNYGKDTACARISHQLLMTMGQGNYGEASMRSRRGSTIHQQGKNMQEQSKQQNLSPAAV